MSLSNNAHCRVFCTLQFLCLLAIPASCMSADNSKAPYAYSLPTEYALGGFSYADDTLYLFQYKGGQLFKAMKSGVLTPVEDVKGWKVIDVAVIDGKPIYCSRNRVFKKVNGKIKVNPIPGCQKLNSITADSRSIYLLDAVDNPAIVVLDKKTGKVRRRLKYDGYRPVEFTVHDGSLWVIDLGDRCMHRVDPTTGKTTLEFQLGPGVLRGCHGVVFIDGKMYIHEVDYGRLRRLDWKEEKHRITSWSIEVDLTFVQASSNKSPTGTSRVDFWVPIPPNRNGQRVTRPQWSSPPQRISKDRFSQSIARFSGIQIRPGGNHELRYKISDDATAVQYDLPDQPLDSLKDIPTNIKRLYLAKTDCFKMTERDVVAAAKAARSDRRGREPRDVRKLIENIAAYVEKNVKYQLNDSWSDAASVLSSGKGSCSEYSFLFSSLCRLNGVPTRLVGGVQIGDYGKKHQTSGFHRWTEVWYPTVGWVPIDVTKIDDDSEKSHDYEFLFGSPGYLIVLSQGGIDADGLGFCYSIRRAYRGGRRQRKTYVIVEPKLGTRKFPVVALKKR